MHTSPPRHDLSFPLADSRELSQAEAVFYLREGGERLQLRFHDYDQIYSRPGLYEQLFYRRLRRTSPAKASEVLAKVLANNNEHINGLRVMDLGAGNGIIGELPDAARLACERDRPHAYDAYYVKDLSCPDQATLAELRRW